MSHDELMCIQQTRDLHRHLFPASWWTFNARSLRDVMCHRQRYPSKQLNSLGDGVNEFHLLLEMLIEKKMQLIERGAGYLPMGLLIKIAQRDGVGEHLVQLLGHFQANIFFKF